MPSLTHARRGPVPPRPSARPASVGFVSLGCPKALVDSERILTELRARDYRIAPDYRGADLVIVNTCGFIDAARTESLEAIGEALRENGRVIVTGCLGKQHELVRLHHPKVLEITGPQRAAEVLAAVERHLPAPRHDPRTSLVPAQGVKLTPPHYAYLKVAEGCNHKCSFCIIPSLRGKLESRPIGAVMREAERLVASGVKELLVIAQDTSAYGADLKYRTGFWHGRPYKTRFGDLCRALGSLGVWVRLHYVYPYPHVDEVIPLMGEGRLLPYLDVPLQHGSPRILKLMKRPAATEDTLASLRRWRAICPDLTVRSTFIVGFPGETEGDFAQLLEFLKQAQIDRAGCFTYSAVEGARANALPNAVPDEIKQERYARFMRAQKRISAARLRRRLGTTMTVLVDEVRGSRAVARSSADAPEIDGRVLIRDARGLEAGEFAEVVIEHSGAYDLRARPAAVRC
jgi:ribosomal protein S12 methylthiotransferase